ncbi:hypothetical protein D3C75_642270 [compost metagenome]
MELEERKRPPLSADFHREERYKSRNLQTTAAGSPNILRSPDEVPNVKILSSHYIGLLSGRGCLQLFPGLFLQAETSVSSVPAYSDIFC